MTVEVQNPCGPGRPGRGPRSSDIRSPTRMLPSRRATASTGTRMAHVKPAVAMIDILDRRYPRRVSPADRTLIRNGVFGFKGVLTGIARSVFLRCDCDGLAAAVCPLLQTDRCRIACSILAALVLVRLRCQSPCGNPHPESRWLDLHLNAGGTPRRHPGCRGVSGPRTPCRMRCLPQGCDIAGRHNGALVAPTRALVIDHRGNLVVLELVGEGRHGGGIHDPGDGFSL